MSENKTEPIAPDGTIRIHPIGVVHSAVTKQQDGGFQRAECTIELLPKYQDYLVGLDEYSHLKVVYWLSEMTETHGIHRPQGNPDAPMVGMFACR